MGAPDVATVGRMLSAGVMNMANVVNKVKEDIRTQLGDEMADEFLKAIKDDVKDGVGESGTLKQMTEIMVGQKEDVK